MLNSHEPIRRTPHDSVRQYREFKLLCESKKNVNKKQWKIVDGSDQSVLHTFQNESNAREALINLAQDHRPSRVIILNFTGKICGSSFYP